MLSQLREFLTVPARLGWRAPRAERLELAGKRHCNTFRYLHRARMRHKQRMLFHNLFGKSNQGYVTNTYIYTNQSGNRLGRGCSKGAAGFRRKLGWAAGLAVRLARRCAAGATPCAVDCGDLPFSTLGIVWVKSKCSLSSVNAARSCPHFSRTELWTTSRQHFFATGSGSFRFAERARGDFVGRRRDGRNPAAEPLDPRSSDRRARRGTQARRTTNSFPVLPSPSPISPSCAQGLTELFCL